LGKHLKLKVFSAILFASLAGAYIGSDTAPRIAAQLTNLDTQAGVVQRPLTYVFDERRTLSGNYLASQFAQRRHDWQKANVYIDRVLAYAPDNVLLMNKAMVLAMGSGQEGEALHMARKIVAVEKDNALALMFLTMEAFKNKEYEKASELVKTMPEGSLSAFILPLLQSWSDAAMGLHNTQSLNQNTIHIYHAILIAGYLHDISNVENLLQASLSAQGLSLQDLERIAAVYAHIGKKDVAIALYEKVLQQWPENRAVAQTLEKLKNGAEMKGFASVTAPEFGVAEALHDMAQLLYQEYSDESARVFAHMTLYLKPDMTDAKLLLASVSARNEQVDEAIAFYKSVPSTDERYSEAHRAAVELLENSGRKEEALAELEAMVQQNNDLEAMIQIGDIHRRNDEFDKAIHTYNRAAQILGKDIPKEYWQLYYVRGMSYERLGQWDKAESDLKAALAFQPDHPMVLNYLGYAWADQGVNLQESLDLIRKAADLEPTDGYITDSLGWVLYRMGDYAESVPHLERAVELLPYDPVINDHLGDAYWRVGRKMEARFQWMRAKNHADDNSLVTQIDVKLDQGLKEIATPALDIVKQARTTTGEADTILRP
jgi:tetratricopeptide (TPR) repeat protein